MPTTMELQRDIMICAGNMASCAVERALTMPRGQHPMFGIRVQSDKWAVKYQEESERLQALVLLIDSIPAALLGLGDSTPVEQAETK